MREAAIPESWAAAMEVPDIWAYGTSFFYPTGNNFDSRGKESEVGAGVAIPGATQYVVLLPRGTDSEGEICCGRGLENRYFTVAGGEDKNDTPFDSDVDDLINSSSTLTAQAHIHDYISLR